jgi:CDP-glucose 4,6-dehydratase
VGVTLASLPDSAFWADKRVLLTGHTGFKGSWTALWLAAMGAKVTGFALAPDTEPSLFEIAGVARDLNSIIGDIRDVAALRTVIGSADPQIVIHMAAQPLVRRSLADPLETISTNVQGTANLLEALRRTRALQAVLVITSDKVYANDASGNSFAESSTLGGKDPYSASKAAAELVTLAFAASYFDKSGVPVATARAGNIIGGGDFAEDRLVPDVVRAIHAGKRLTLRHPNATRPWQHVLDCVTGYLLFAKALTAGRAVPRALNFGPGPGAAVTVAGLAHAMQTALGQKPAWDHVPVPGSIEMTSIPLDSSQARQTLGWRDPLAGAASVAWTADWYRAFTAGANARTLTLEQIASYRKLKLDPA